MRTLWYILPAVLLAGCATKQPAASQPPPVAPVAAVVPTKAVETRYDVRGYREAANPSIRHEAHAVYRRTIVPANAADDTGTVPRTAFAPASHAPLSGDAELAAELATQKAITGELRAMQSSMAETERRMQAQYAQLVRQSTEAARLREQLEADRSRLRSGVPPAPSEPVAANATAPTEAKWGERVMSIAAEHLEKLRTLPDRLKAVLTGQDAAIDLVAERLQHGELGLTVPSRPKASFLFLGPTGVGKTELTLRFTEDLLGPDRVVRLDMSEYQTADRLGLLLGTADEPGRIAEGFDACAGSGTLLFDEIEKAHPRVLDVLLQLLDAARLTTGRNRVLDFSAWYVVLTSNIGAQRIMTLRKSKYETMERLVRQDAQRELRPEIFARITVTVVFNKLDYEAQCAIASGLVEKECRTLAGLGYRVSPEPSVQGIVVSRGYHERLGARPMRDAAELLVRNALARELLRGGDGSGRLLPHSDGMKLHLNPAAS